ncbi:hypothetical protein OROGR_015535 [Orobanche gracilis]
MRLNKVHNSDPISSQFESTVYDFLSEYKYPNRISERISSLSDKFNKSTYSVIGEHEIQRKNNRLINSGFEESRSCSNGTIHEQLLEIKQSKSVEEYRNRLISLAASLESDSDEIKLREFVNGFETVVRVEMRLRSPTCLEEAIQFAVKIEERNRDLMRLRIGRDWAYQKAQSVAQIVVVESSSQGPRIFKIKPTLQRFTVSSVNRVEEIENEEAELVLALDSFKKSAPASSIRNEGGGGWEISYKEKSGRCSIKNRTILESLLIKRSSGYRVAVDLNEGAFDLDSFISDILSNTWEASDNESITVDSDNWDFNAKNKGNLVAMPFDRGRLFFTIESDKIERPIYGAQESTGRKGRSCAWWVEMISGKSKVTMPFDRGHRVQINHQSDQNPKDESKIYTAQFSQIGIKFIDCLREEELICRREMVLLSAIFCLRKKNCTEEWEIFPGLAPMAASIVERDGDQLFKVYAGEYGVSGIIRSSDPGALPFDRRLKHQIFFKISPWGQGERLAGCKFLVFAHHQPMIDAIHKFLLKEKVECIRIDGSTPAASRQALVTEFQEKDSVRAAVLSIKAGGVGLTLTAASTVIFAELSWTPGDIIQAEDRAHRIGQVDLLGHNFIELEASFSMLDTEIHRLLHQELCWLNFLEQLKYVSSVNIYYLLANDTVDDIIWDVIQNKLENLGQMLDGQENTLQVSVNRPEYSSLKASGNQIGNSPLKASGNQPGNSPMKQTKLEFFLKRCNNSGSDNEHRHKHPRT